MLYKFARGQALPLAHFTSCSSSAAPLLQLARHVGELALVQLRLPEDGVGIVEAMLDPALFLDVVEVDVTTRVGVAVRRSQDRTAAQLQRVLVRKIVAVLGVQHTVRKRLARAHAEQVTRKASAVAVDVVESGALLLGDARAHGAHAQAHSLVAVDQVGQDLACRGHADAALLAQLVQAALDAQPRQPVLAVGRATGHGSQQHAVDLNHLLDRLRRDPVTSRRSRIRRHDDAALETERQCCRAVGNLDGAVGVRSVVGGSSQPGGRLLQIQR